jgi:3-deoxy-7-phosphoheptulonate synthase
LNPSANSHFISTQPLLSPEQLKTQYPISENIEKFITKTRKNIQGILKHQTDKHLIIVGPCSIHNTQSGLAYAEKLKKVANDIKETCTVLMRTYFEKPRTSSGWKGLIIDPHLNGTPNIPEGLHKARAFLKALAKMELGAATEFIDPLTPLYIGDLISWAAIGARTAESPTHRHLASGLPMPVGIKNNTAGCTKSAIFGVEAARQSQSYLGINEQGQASAITTQGNPYTHIILRGGQSGPNYHKENITEMLKLLKSHGIESPIMIDCSHGNSQKNAHLQPAIFEDVCKQMVKKETPIIGLMFESHLEGGAQSFNPSQSNRWINPNQSITDDCLSWHETQALLYKAHDIFLSPSS